MVRDKSQQVTMARHDNLTRQSKISSARRLINLKGHLVDGAAVEALLKAESLVPAAVRIIMSITGVFYSI
jgi:hypothetical protein